MKRENEKPKRPYNRKTTKQQKTLRIDTKLLAAAEIWAEAHPGMKLTDALEQGLYLLVGAAETKEQLALRFEVNRLTLRMQKLTSAFIAFMETKYPGPAGAAAQAFVEKVLEPYMEPRRDSPVIDIYVIDHNERTLLEQLKTNW